MKTQTIDARKTLRQEIRQKRKSLNPHAQRQATERVSNKILNSKLFHRCQHLACFLAADGEIDLTLIIDQAIKENKCCYLPMIRKDDIDALLFYRYLPGDELVQTKLGVYEPGDQREAIAAEDLDVVLTPLVAFDQQANRMGMGKGYYDRTFAFKNSPHTKADKPFLLGIAHECQRVESLETAWWDVPLDAIVTPENLYGAKELL